MLHSGLIKDNIENLLKKWQLMESQIESELEELKKREEYFKKIDEKANELSLDNKTTVAINVGGQLFRTYVSTLANVADTLFFKIVTSGKLDLKNGLFFDRSPKYFGSILDYLRYKKINLKRFTRKQKLEINQEFEFYELWELIETQTNKGELEFVSFSFSEQYSKAWTNKVEDLADPSQLKGICVNTPGFIIIDFNNVYTITAITVGGYNGNPNMWGIATGASAQILTSVDKSNWTAVGNLPSTYGYNAKIQLTPSDAQYIQFKHSSHIGIGYLSMEYS